MTDEKLFRPFGGSYLKGNNAKEKRPFSSQKSLHLVMRSRLARGTHSFRKNKNQRRIDSIVYKQAKAFGLRLYEYANVGNHLHILLRAPSREAFRGFVRALSGLIARYILNVERGRAQAKPPKKDNRRFWDDKPFSRVVAWGKAFYRAKNYVRMNEKEARGLLSSRQLKELAERGLLIETIDSQDMILSVGWNST